MQVTTQQFGILSNGQKVSLFTISNKDISISITNYGCRITSILMKDKNGNIEDIVQGYSTLEGYIYDTCHFGSFIGRFANRISNATFSIAGEKYSLDKNDGKNTLHGGFTELDKKVWKAKITKSNKNCTIQFSLTSKDGEQGFPGDLNIVVKYILDDKNNFTCKYSATTNKETPVNFTNHSYFNLSGKGTIKDHILKLNCDKYLKVNKNLIPTGDFISVANSEYDFRKSKKIGKDLTKVGLGYDNCFVTEMYNKNDKNCGVPLSDKKLVRVAEVIDSISGRKMTIDSNMEGVQLYTGNMLNNVCGKNGLKYSNHSSLCLETQSFPDSPNINSFPSCILHPGEKYISTTVFSFSII